VIDSGPAIQQQTIDWISDTSGTMPTPEDDGIIEFILLKKMVSRLKGKLSVESHSEKSNKVSLTIPLSKDIKPEETSVACLQGCSVIVVEDDLAYRKTIVHHLSSWGCRVAEAEDGISGFNTIEKQHHNGHAFDLAIFDQNMPGLSGLECATDLQQLNGFKRPAMIMLTSLEPLNIKAQAQSLGFSNVLRKPVAADRLQREVIRAIEQGSKTQNIKTQQSSEIQNSASKVLVVEDNPINQKVIAKMLKKCQLDCDIVDNGLSACQTFALGRYSMVLMDIEIPKLNGLETTRAIRKTTSGLNIPIIGFSAHLSDRIQQECQDAGMSDFLAKPVSWEGLKASLEKWNVLD
jgi:CheY-like chemotaxis protein